MIHTIRTFVVSTEKRIEPRHMVHMEVREEDMINLGRF